MKVEHFFISSSTISKTRFDLSLSMPVQDFRMEMISAAINIIQMVNLCRFLSTATAAKIISLQNSTSHELPIASLIELFLSAMSVFLQGIIPTEF